MSLRRAGKEMRADTEESRKVQVRFREEAMQMFTNHPTFKSDFIPTMLATLFMLFAPCFLFAEDGSTTTVRAQNFTSSKVLVNSTNVAPRQESSAVAPSGLTINPKWDSSIASDSRFADIQSTINAAIAAYKANFSDPITVAITFKKVDTGLGGSCTMAGTFKYSDYRAALASHATSADDALAISALPDVTNNPVNGDSKMCIQTALARALGFTGGQANPPTGMPDCTISLNIAQINILPTDTDPRKFSLFAVVSHEIDEALGVGSILNNLGNGDPAPKSLIYPEDLFRYDLTGARSFNTDASSAAFFSLNGATQLARFNQRQGGDFSDWDNSGQAPKVQDAFGTPGASAVLGVELRVLDVLGYTRNASTHSATKSTSEVDGFDVSAAPSSNDQTVTLMATVSSNASIVNDGTVIFKILQADGITVIGSPVTSATVMGGAARVQYFVPGGTPAGAYEISAFYTGGAAFLENADETHSLILGTKSLKVSSPLSAMPSVTSIGQSIDFTLAISGNKTLSYDWQFGDGTEITTTTGNATHVYATHGTYAVVVNARESSSTNSICSMTTVTVTQSIVGIGLDTDGDGFSDDFENFIGTDPINSASTPTGHSITAADVQPMTLKGQSIALNFASGSETSDQIKFTAYMQLPAGADVNTASVFMDVNGVPEKSTASVVKRFAGKKTGFTISMNGNYKDTLAKSNLGNANAKNVPVTIVFTLIVNNVVYQQTQQMKYTCSELKLKGSAK